MGMPAVLKAKSDEPSLTTQALQRLEQLRIEQGALRQQLAEERRQHSQQVQEAVRANDELRDHIRRVRDSAAGQAIEAAQQSGGAWEPQSSEMAYAEVDRLEKARTATRQIHHAAEEAQRIASHQSASRADDSREFYDKQVGERLGAVNTNSAAHGSLQHRIAAAQEELGALLFARKEREEQLQAALDAHTAQANREYAAACLIQRAWRRYKHGQPMPKAIKTGKKGGKKGKSAAKGSKSPKGSPKKGGATKEKSPKVSPKKGATKEKSVKGSDSPKKKGDKAASPAKSKTAASKPKAKAK